MRLVNDHGKATVAVAVAHQIKNVWKLLHRGHNDVFARLQVPRQVFGLARMREDRGHVVKGLNGARNLLVQILAVSHHNHRSKQVGFGRQIMTLEFGQAVRQPRNGIAFAATS